MDWDTITPTGARASGVEEGTPRMVVQHRVAGSDTVRDLPSGPELHAGQTPSWCPTGYVRCRLNRRDVSEGAA